MSKIKGCYAATITFYFDYDDEAEEAEDFMSFGELRSVLVDGELTDEVKSCLLSNIFEDGMGTLKVHQRCAELYREDVHT